MKFKVTMKNPDALIDSITEAVKDLSSDGIEEDEIEDFKETRIEEVKSICAKWFKWGEYLTVEVDTEDETCVVLQEK